MIAEKCGTRGKLISRERRQVDARFDVRVRRGGCAGVHKALREWKKSLNTPSDSISKEIHHSKDTKYHFRILSLDLIAHHSRLWLTDSAVRSIIEFTVKIFRMEIDMEIGKTILDGHGSLLWGRLNFEHHTSC